jgi:hypothetical protein
MFHIYLKQLITLINFFLLKYELDPFAYKKIDAEELEGAKMRFVQPLLGNPRQA